MRLQKNMTKKKKLYYKINCKKLLAKNFFYDSIKRMRDYTGTPKTKRLSKPSGSKPW